MNSLIALPESFMSHSKMLLVDGLQGVGGQWQLLAGQSGQWRVPVSGAVLVTHSSAQGRGLPGIYPSSSAVHCFVSAVTLTVFAVSELPPQSLSGLRLNSPALLHPLGMFSRPLPSSLDSLHFTQTSLAQSV